MLRRPLEEVSQSQQETARNQAATEAAGDQMEVDRPQAEEAEQEQVQAAPAPAPAPAPPPRRVRARRGAASRFKGFDFGSDDEDETPTPVPEPDPEPEPVQATEASQDSLFVSQHQGFDAEVIEEEEPEVRPAARKTQRKRPLSPLPEHDNSAFMDTLARTAASA